MKNFRWGSCYILSYAAAPPPPRLGHERKIMKDSIRHGVKAQGRKELKKHLDGVNLTYKQAALAKCYECNLGYCDGKCSCEVLDCPLFQYMPYKNKGWD